MRVVKFFPIFFIGIIAVQCSTPPESPIVCTTEFVTFSITVVDTTGEPADSVQITVKNTKSGEPYDVCQGTICDSYGAGRYTIMHDGFHGKISEKREPVTVKGTKGEQQFTADFAFRSGDCHVRKLAGPDTVSLAPNLKNKNPDLSRTEPGNGMNGPTPF